MKYLMIVTFMIGCSSAPKKGCRITRIECHPDNRCVLIFDDNSDFTVPVSMLDYLKVNDNLCKK